MDNNTPNNHNTNPAQSDPNAQVPPPPTGAPLPPQQPYQQQVPPQPVQATYVAPAPAQAPYSPLAIVGFILSFFFSLIGMIVSIVALVSLKKDGKRGKGLSIAGIIIGGVMVVVNIIATLILLGGIAVVANEYANNYSDQSSSSSSIEESATSHAARDADYVASISEASFAGIDTQTIEFEINREAHTPSISDFVTMTVPAEWLYDDVNSDIGAQGEIVYSVALPSGAIAAVHFSTLPAVEYMDGSDQPTVIDTEYAAELFDSVYMFETDSTTTLWGKDLFIGSYTFTGGDAFTLLVAEDTDSYSDVIFICDISIDDYATDEDYEYLMGYIKAAFVSVLEYDIDINRAAEE